ncbi:phytoene/squalene synthase family protein [Palleronia sediminis]|uniref:Phytoene/squalene synthase family protein n=1 Tax=Palleronia sediminis TaxID=2547833 RepID=A0A4R5ZYA9_9RHOB|nr:phytoene/squalene synthase family protein [Palleronia sediminis]TDL75244.1 phytoene/squalene synthase family protein [Palleronia sediminis]
MTAVTQDPAARDMAECHAAIATGSYSFHAASRLLPRKVRDPAIALYAFCRSADDAVDLGQDRHAALAALRERLSLIYEGRPRNLPSDRAFARVVEAFDLPATLPEALLEGLAWDAEGRRYDDIGGLYAYSARVAAAVGAMMCVLMRRRGHETVARACDLGVAMQLTNIARDIGEDAMAGRLYVPRDWLAADGLSEDAFLARPEAHPALRRYAARLLSDADRLYMRSEAGIPDLPLSARPGIFAARHVYAGIGGALRRQGCDPTVGRARTNRAQKAGWLGLSLLRTGTALAMPRSAVRYARPLPEVAFLVQAAATAAPEPDRWEDGRAGRILGIFATLRETRDMRSQG